MGMEGYIAASLKATNTLSLLQNYCNNCNLQHLLLAMFLDGGVQLGILIEDNAQRQLEFGGDLIENYF